MPVVIGRAGGDHATVLMTVDIPEAPGGLVDLLVRGRKQIAIGDFAVEKDPLFPVFDARELLLGCAELLDVVTAKSGDLGELFLILRLSPSDGCGITVEKRARESMKRRETVGAETGRRATPRNCRRKRAN